MNSNLLIVSASPHIHDNSSVSKLMHHVIIALMPTLAVSLYYFGLGALIITTTSILSCLFFEWFIQRYILKTEVRIKDGSAILTGLLLAFCLPANLPVWIVIIGSLVAIGVGKMSFGGLGQNPFNPALVGRVFLFISYPVQMTSWPVPSASRLAYLDAGTGATPLGLVKEGIKNNTPFIDIVEKLPSHQDLFFGHMSGSMGEIAAIALIIGFIYLLVTRVITWHITISILFTVFAFTGIMWLSDKTAYADPVFHLLSGGLLLGAIFMATDYVTSPMTKTSMLIYGTGIGLITIVIRVFGDYPEGVQFAILIMNATVPLLNTIKPKRFGNKK
jgi:electron transport complex protein RnfD